MADNTSLDILEKYHVLNDHGLDTLLQHLFRIIEDNYMRKGDNPFENVSFEIRSDGCLYVISAGTYNVFFDRSLFIEIIYHIFK